MNAIESHPSVVEAPEFWLGKIAVIGEMGANGDLTKHQTVGELQRILRAMKTQCERQRLARNKPAGGLNAEA
ncbi:MAG: hypothetical protein ACTHLW_16200 [Verrucomicrobiota bacterium]